MRFVTNLSNWKPLYFEDFAATLHTLEIKIFIFIGRHNEMWKHNSSGVKVDMVFYTLHIVLYAFINGLLLLLINCI
jgi:hypothetical protein